MTYLPAKNARIEEQLNDAITSQQIFHAYTFISIHKEASEAFAKKFIKGILTGRRLDDTQMDEDDERTRALLARIEGDRHEDIIVVRKKKNTTPIDSIRDMQNKISVRPIGVRHIVLIADGDEMSDEAQNALLKTLEEPPGDTVIIILAENRENLLPTVRSRCIICELNEETEVASPEIEEAASGLINGAADGDGYYKLKKTVSSIGESREDIERLIDRAEDISRDRLFRRDDNGVPFNQEKTMEEIRAMEEARNKLNRGINPKYVIKELLLKIGG